LVGDGVGPGALGVGRAVTGPLVGSGTGVAVPARLVGTGLGAVDGAAGPVGLGTGVGAAGPAAAGAFDGVLGVGAADPAALAPSAAVPAGVELAP
jgi:hypothetical protein